MMTSVLGALAGGAIFQWLFGFNFSVAVQVGYIACFGMAVETGVVMLVYLHEAIDERGGLERIGSIAELRQAILEGAIHRLRPKLLTEGAAIISIAPMLWATGVGAEVIRPMAAPVLGGLLIADEVIDVFLPVLYFAVQKRQWAKLHRAGLLDGRAGLRRISENPGPMHDHSPSGSRERHERIARFRPQLARAAGGDDDVLAAVHLIGRGGRVAAGREGVFPEEFGRSACRRRGCVRPSCRR